MAYAPALDLTTLFEVISNLQIRVQKSLCHFLEISALILLPIGEAPRGGGEHNQPTNQLGT